MTGIAAALFAVPGQAADNSGAVLDALVKARLAEEVGAPQTALAALSVLASHQPDLPGLRARILEQAIAAGDLASARSAAMQLWEAGERRFDARLVLLVDALRRSDWKAGQIYVPGHGDQTGGDAISRLIGPTIDGWVATGARQQAPERALIAASEGMRPEPSMQLQAALIQLAAGRRAEAVATIGTVRLTDRTSQLMAVRVAATLDRAGEKDAADRLRGRIALAASGREDPMLMLPDQPVSAPREGVALWLALLADGFARTPNSSPQVSLLFARAAYWLNDRDWAARSALVEALDRSERPADAMALLAEGRGGMPPVLRMRRAELMADTGDMAGAARLAEQAAAQQPPARALLLRFADVARRSEDGQAIERSFAGLEAVLGEGEDDVALRAMLLIARAELLLQADDWDAAEPLMDRAIAKRPDDADILNFVGYSALERRKHVERSLAQVEAAWEKDPQSAAITDSLGWAYFLTGRVEEAVPLLERAQIGAPDNAVIVEHLGDAYWQAGRRFEARYSWRAAALLADADMTTRLEAKLRDGLTLSTTAP